MSALPPKADIREGRHHNRHNRQVQKRPFQRKVIGSLDSRLQSRETLKMMKNKTHAIGWKVSDFALPGIDGKTYSLAEVRGPKGTLVVWLQIGRGEHSGSG